MPSEGSIAIFGSGKGSAPDLAPAAGAAGGETGGEAEREAAESEPGDPPAAAMPEIDNPPDIFETRLPSDLSRTVFAFLSHYAIIIKKW